MLWCPFVEQVIIAILCFKWLLWNSWIYIPFPTRNVHQTCKCHYCSRLLVLQTFVIAYEIMLSKHSIMHNVEGFLFDFKDNVLVHIFYYVFYWCKTFFIRTNLCVVVFVIFANFLTILHFLLAFCNFFWSENVNQTLSFWRVWCSIKVKCHHHLMLLLWVLPLTSL
jgi:hypothetical protein